MRVVICLSGLDTAEFVHRALERLPDSTEITLLYVIDSRPAEEINYVRRTHLFGGRTGLRRNLEMLAAERELASEIVAEARLEIEQTRGAVRPVQQIVLEGRPERKIVEYIDQHGADLLVLGTRYRSDLTQAAPPLPPPPEKRPAEPLPHLEPRPDRGPHSVGPIARFIIDHALCDLLILKY